jgi:hypothetical protein
LARAGAGTPVAEPEPIIEDPDMMKFWIAALVAVVLALPAAAMARPHARGGATTSHGSSHHGIAHRAAATASRRHHHGRSASHRHFRGYASAHRHRAAALAQGYRAYAYAPAGAPGVSSVPAVQARPMVAARRADGARVGGLVAPLAEKVAQIAAACGTQVISGVRHTHVAGTGRMSLHASGQAADLRGNPGCVYRMLQGWAGGYSTDYGRVHHVHLSWGGREQGLRFAHGGGGHRHAHARSHQRRPHVAVRFYAARRG